MGKPLRLGDLALTQGQKHVTAKAGNHIGGDRNAAITPLGDKGQGGGVISREKPKVCSDQHSQARDTTCVAGSILEFQRLEGVQPTLQRFRLHVRMLFASARHKE